MGAIGYKQVRAMLSGEMNQEECRQEIILRTRQYAKRQMTWFRRDQSIHWLDTRGDYLAQARSLIAGFLGAEGDCL